ncbi:MAG: hypothetical protein K5657_09450 [Desulfovibrio sp.]|nr:hypothetical protein [Desulfovibrio sp.]
MITDEVIASLHKLSFHTIEDSEISEYLYLHCQQVLRFAKDKNDSGEVARAIDLITLDVIGTVAGDQNSVDIDFLVKKMRGSSNAFLVMHNHPSDMHFSRRDLKTFTDAENMSVLIAIGNNGSIFIAEKTRQLSQNEVLSIHKSLLDWKGGRINFELVIEQIHEFGIVYSEI